MSPELHHQLSAHFYFIQAKNKKSQFIKIAKNKYFHSFLY